MSSNPASYPPNLFTVQPGQAGYPGPGQQQQPIYVVQQQPQPAQQDSGCCESCLACCICCQCCVSCCSLFTCWAELCCAMCN